MQVLFNLTSNAAKFTHSGYIRVGAGYLPHEDMVFLYVRDTGCGIEANIMPKVFRVFEQADMTTTRAHGGAGLGLHFVQELVRAHRHAFLLSCRSPAFAHMTCVPTGAHKFTRRS